MCCDDRLYHSLLSLNTLPLIYNYGLARSIALTIPTAASYLYHGSVTGPPLGNLSHATAIILAFMCARHLTLRVIVMIG